MAENPDNNNNDQLVSAVVEDIANGTGGLGFHSHPVKSDTGSSTALHLCDVSSELRCPGAKPRR